MVFPHSLGNYSTHPVSIHFQSKIVQKKFIRNHKKEIIAEFGFLICEEEEETVVETAIGVLPQVVLNCSEKNCFTEIIPLLTVSTSY